MYKTLDLISLEFYIEVVRQSEYIKEINGIR